LAAPGFATPGFATLPGVATSRSGGAPAAAAGAPGAGAVESDRVLSFAAVVVDEE
jgi:hypothetical protein